MAPRWRCAYRSRWVWFVARQWPQSSWDTDQKVPGGRGERPRGMADYRGVDVSDRNELEKIVIKPGPNWTPLPLPRGGWVKHHTGQDEWVIINDDGSLTSSVPMDHRPLSPFQADPEGDDRG